MVFGKPLAFLRIVGVALIATACHGGGSSEGGPPPTGFVTPDTTTLSGTWTGTLSRPSGLPSMLARWEVTHLGQSLSGPMTLTNGSTTVTFPLTASLGGGADFSNTNPVYRLNLRFSFLAGAVANLPNCSIASDDAHYDGLKVSDRSFTTPPFTIHYNSCDGFVDPPRPLRNQLDETTQLALARL